jgi:PASTA domain
MTDDLKERFRSLDSLEFPYREGPPPVRRIRPPAVPDRRWRAGTAVFALLIGGIALGFAIRAFGGGPDDEKPPPASSEEIETGPGTCDDGPWIEHCPEAEWARSVVDVAGLEIVDEQTVLVVGAPGAAEFHFWAMDPALHGGSVEPLPEIVADGVARVIDHVDGLPIYGFRSNARLWLWSHHGLNVWVDGRGPGGATPSREDLVALVRASRAVPYRSTTPPPSVTIPNMVRLTDQQGMIALDDLGLTWIVGYRTVDGVDPWRITSVDPPAGSRVAPGSIVRLLVATDVTPLPPGATDALDCDVRHREAFGGPNARVLPGDSLYIVGNLPGIEPEDDVVQVTFGDERWMGLWHVIRNGSVVAVVDYGSLDGVACQGSGVAGA